MAHGHGDGGGFAEFFEHNIAEFNPFDMHSFLDWIGEWGISRGVTLILIFIGLYSILSIQIPSLILFTFGWLAATAPIWLPVSLWMAAWKAWVNYVRSDFLSHKQAVLLEIKIPREITKSPRAMELVFAQLYVSSGEVSFLHRAWDGSVRPWFSFEIASFGGEIHFYVWCWKQYRRNVETAIYAQYPEVEIIEVEDFMSKFRYDPEIHTCRVGDHFLRGRGDEYPVKSYIDFELDKDPKEEFKVEPLATSFEVLSNLKPTEQVWMQMNLRLAGSNTEGVLWRDKDDWGKRVIAAVDKIRLEMIIKEDPADRGFPRPTWKQNEMIMAMERHLGKVPFNIGMRFIYIVEGKLDGPTFTSVRWIYKVYNSPNYFNVMRSGRGHDPFDYPWQDYQDIRWNLATRRHIDAMRRRSFFYTPWVTPHMTISTELMASFHHYPSSTVRAPGLQRVPSKKSEPPPNLPR